MWVQLDKNEITTIRASINDEAILKKLDRQSHPDADAFREAADNDDITPDHDGFVERTRNGAYVHAWVWVTNEEAGFTELTDFEDVEITDATREALEALQNFTVDYPEETTDNGGLLDGQHWHFQANEQYWTFYVGTEFSREEERFWIDEAWPTAFEDTDDLTMDDVYPCILRSVAAYRASGRIPMDRNHPSYERHILIGVSQFNVMIGDALKFLGQDLASLNHLVQSHGLYNENFEMEFQLFVADENYRLEKKRILARGRS